MSSRTCKVCGVEKDMGMFHTVKRKNGSSSTMRSCKLCFNLKRREKAKEAKLQRGEGTTRRWGGLAVLPEDIQNKIIEIINDKSLKKEARYVKASEVSGVYIGSIKKWNAKGALYISS